MLAAGTPELYRRIKYEARQPHPGGRTVLAIDHQPAGDLRQAEAGVAQAKPTVPPTGNCAVSPRSGCTESRSYLRVSQASYTETLKVATSDSHLGISRPGHSSSGGVGSHGLTARPRSGRSAGTPDGNRDGNNGSRQRPGATVHSHVLPAHPA